MADAQMDHDDLGPGTHVDVAPRADETAPLGQSTLRDTTLRDMRSSLREPSDDDAVDEMAVDEMAVDEMAVDEMAVDEMAVDEMMDTLPRRVLFAAPITSPLTPEEIELEGVPAEPALQAVGRAVADPVEDDIALPPPRADAAVVADKSAETPAASSARASAEPERDSDALRDSDVDAFVPDVLSPEPPSAGIDVVETATARQPSTVAGERAQPDDDALIPGTWDTYSDDATADDATLSAAATETADDAVTPDVVMPETAEDPSVTLADETPELLEAPAPVATELHEVSDDVAMLAADDISVPVAEPDATLPEPAMSLADGADALASEPAIDATEADVPPDVLPAVAVADERQSEPEMLADQAPLADDPAPAASALPAVVDVQETTPAVPPESATPADAAAGLLYGYASAPTRPRSAPPPVPRTPPPPVPLPPPLPPSSSSWSVPSPTSAAGAAPAPKAGPLYPPLPVAAGSAPPRMPRSRLPSIAGVDTRVPQEYWLEDDPMEHTRLSLGLSGERPVVREAGRPLPKPRRFKRPPRPISLFVLVLVLAIILLTVVGVTLTVAHLLAQPASTPIVVPTHSALPTGTSSQGL